MKKFILLMILTSATVLFTGCGDTNDADLCEGNPCKDSLILHKTKCEVDGNDFKCVCEDGYEANGAVCKAKEVTPCTPNPCTETNKTTCTETGTTIDDYTCSCDSGYYDKEGACTLEKTCETDSCTETNKTQCSIVNHEIECSCDAGFIDNSGTCEEAQTACVVTKGTGTNTLMVGTILMEDSYLENAQLVFSSDGTILCVGADCSADSTDATVINCGNNVISPALINAHDHISYTQSDPGDLSAYISERYDHRHDWRKGNNNHTNLQAVTKDGEKVIRSGGSSDEQAWGELRNLMAGATVMAGSGGAKGFLRNVDRGMNDNVVLNGVKYNTFPLGDTGGTTIDSGCGYNYRDTESVLSNHCYLPHVSEGITKGARNEFLCLSSTNNGGHDLTEANSAFVHMIGLNATDAKEVANEHTAVIWSPRSNISLYGNTAQIPMYFNLGVLVGLGTDWTPSGSINMLRELQCVDYLNTNHYAKALSDKQIWELATRNNAEALLISDRIGILKEGRIADISVYALNDAINPYRAVIDAKMNDVILVLKAGVATYGDTEVMNQFESTSNGCEAIGDVCGVDKTLCTQREIGKSFSALKDANDFDLPDKKYKSYDLFFCGTPRDEPTCEPMRPQEYNGDLAGSDRDGDGVDDNSDNCIDIFNPIRPMDNGVQSDVDNDGIGDACDLCPTVTGETCEAKSPYDKDDDGIGSNDNCPTTANADQADADNDGKGDVCDACPDIANPGAMGCPASIQDVKQKTLALGSTVTVKGYVTAIDSAHTDNFFIQLSKEDQDSTLKEKFSGIYVYRTGNNSLTLGDYVSVTGTTKEYYGEIEMASVSNVTKLTPEGTIPDAVVVNASDISTGGSLAGAYEGVLVKVENVSVTAVAPDEYSQLEVTGGLYIGKMIYPISAVVGDSFTSITGVLRYQRENSKLEPRSASDVAQ